MAYIPAVSFYQVRPYDEGKPIEAFCEQRGISRENIIGRDNADSPELQPGEMLVLNCQLPPPTSYGA
ncbi:MAG TPA: hypothetical protein VMT55_06425 [Candidatus Sulfotelmatobacter sp.]|nr:hypothetical protein [Candidatus Sulfotelmatobacter sp.]